jgi:hypothetical protein
MKTLHIITIAALCTAPAVLRAQQIADVTPGNVRLERNGKYLSVDMDVDVSQLDVKSRHAVILTPTLAGDKGDTLRLSSVGIYGRQRYYYYLRNDGTAISGPDEQAYRTSELPDVITYHADAPYEDWMNGSLLNLSCSTYGCCNRVLSTDETTDGIARYKERLFQPLFHFTKPEAAASKELEESGTALIIFPVDQTTLYPNLAANQSELDRIKNDVNRIRDDKDVSGTSITLKGYASPEGTYAHNTDLAAGRTQAVRNYLKSYYHMADGAVTATSEPENWGGLREYVEASTLQHRDEILAIIDQTELEPDAREWKLKQSYPQEYAQLLRDCYPSLRRTEYTIRYQVRAYTDINEIKQIYKTNPKKLSLNELYLLAQTYEVGSDEFSDVFETAVRLYPDDETANLNAATTALRRGELTKAAQYLDAAGSSPEATYDRGLLAALNGQYTDAAALLKEAAEGGVTEASDALNQLTECRLIP